jgi:hypothetical protein
VVAQIKVYRLKQNSNNNHVLRYRNESRKCPPNFPLDVEVNVTLVARLLLESATQKHGRCERSTRIFTNTQPRIFLRIATSAAVRAAFSNAYPDKEARNETGYWYHLKSYKCCSASGSVWNGVLCATHWHYKFISNSSRSGSGNPASHSIEAGFRSWPKDWLSSLRFLVVFFRTSR